MLNSNELQRRTQSDSRRPTHDWDTSSRKVSRREAPIASEMNPHDGPTRGEVTESTVKALLAVRDALVARFHPP